MLSRQDRFIETPWGEFHRPHRDWEDDKRDEEPDNEEDAHDLGMIHELLPL